MSRHVAARARWADSHQGADDARSRCRSTPMGTHDGHRCGRHAKIGRPALEAASSVARQRSRGVPGAIAPRFIAKVGAVIGEGRGDCRLAQIAERVELASRTHRWTASPRGIVHCWRSPPRRRIAAASTLTRPTTGYRQFAVSRLAIRSLPQAFHDLFERLAARAACARAAGCASGSSTTFSCVRKSSRSGSM